MDIAGVLTVDLYIQYSEDRLIQKGVKLSHVHVLKSVFYEIFTSFDHGVLYAVFWQILCSFWTSELIFYILLISIRLIFLKWPQNPETLIPFPVKSGSRTKWVLKLLFDEFLSLRDRNSSNESLRTHLVLLPFVAQWTDKFQVFVPFLRLRSFWCFSIYDFDL